MDLTILILSYNRQNDLKKKINFWNNFRNYNFKILIVDGSSKSAKFNTKNKKIKYIHLKTKDYHKRIFHALRFINTKYFKLESDNDYSFPNAINYAINFLKTNKAYSSVYGKSGIYSIYKNKLYLNEIFRDQMTISNNNFKTRLKKYFSNYSPGLYYSVMRTESFKKTVKLWKNSKKKYGDEFQRFAEIHLPLVLLISGKVKIINRLFWVRHDDDITKRVEFESNKKLIKEDHGYIEISKWYFKNYKTGYFDHFVKNLSLVCKKKNNEKSFYLNDLFYYFYKKGLRKNKKNLLLEILKKILPSKVKKFIRFNFGINGINIESYYNSKLKFNYNFKINEMKIFVKSLNKK